MVVAEVRHVRQSIATTGMGNIVQEDVLTNPLSRLANVASAASLSLCESISIRIR